MTEEQQFAISGDWALGADDLQWILYRRRSEKRGGWEPLSFVRTSQDILARCMREKGVPEDGTSGFARPARTFNQWKNAPSRLLAAA